MITRLEPSGNIRFFDLMGLPHTPVNLLHEDGLIVAATDDQRHLLTIVGQRETAGERKPETKDRKPQDRHDLAIRLTELITARLTRRTS